MGSGMSSSRNRGGDKPALEGRVQHGTLFGNTPAGPAPILLQKLGPDLLHAPAVLFQVPVADTGGGTDLDDVVGGIQHEQPVIDKAEEGPELDLEPRFVGGNDACINRAG